MDQPGRRLGIDNAIKVSLRFSEEDSTNTLVALSAAQLPFAIALTINPQARHRAVAAETEQLAPRFFLFFNISRVA